MGRTVSTRRTALGALDGRAAGAFPPLLPACDSLGPAVWPAFERAGARTRAQLAVPRAPRTADGALVAALCALVRRTVHASVDDTGAPDARALEAALRDADAAVVLDRLRRCFSDELRDASAEAAFGAVHVFNALAQVRAAVQRTAGERPAGDDALDLAVEVAHDMRSPLAAILFMVDMVRTGRSGAVSAVQEQQLGMVYSAALGLNQLACDLIDFVRGGADVIERAPVPFSLAGVLYEVHDVVRPAAEEKGVELRLVLPSDRARVGSPAALNRVLLNLASNALRYSACGAVTIAAEELAGDRVRLSVQDSGSEIPPEVVAQLFQPFRAASSGLRAFSSSGLGLAICHRLVTGLGGELAVATEAGRGATFSFEVALPFAPPFGS